MDNEQLFVCVKCRHVDMIDLAHTRLLQHRQQVEAYIRDLAPLGTTRDDLPALPEYKPYHCTQCLTASWHGLFPYLPYNPKTDRVCNPPFPVC